MNPAGFPAGKIVLMAIDNLHNFFCVKAKNVVTFFALTQKMSDKEHTRKNG